MGVSLQKSEYNYPGERDRPFVAFYLRNKEPEYRDSLYMALKETLQGQIAPLGRSGNVAISF